MITSRAVLRVLFLVAAVGLLTQAVFEFGPLWLVRTSSAGSAVRAVLGGTGVDLWCGRIADRQASPGAPTDTGGVDHPVVGHGAVADLDPLAGIIVTAQVVLALVLAIIGIHASKLLHDAVPSSIRAGVLRRGTMTWVLFLPFSLVFGWTAQQNGVHWSGFMLAGAVVVVGVLLVVSVRASRGVAPAEVAATAKEEAVGGGGACA